jgi:hypothetical protein
MDLKDVETRRGFVKNLTCNHKYLGKVGPGLEWLCDKNHKECLEAGQCPQEETSWHEEEHQ